MTNETFVGYAGLQPLIRNDPNTFLSSFKFTPLPLKPDEVEISVQACGICGSDVHQLTNGWKRARYPIVPGHEFIGEITAIGLEVADLKIGDRVGVSPVCRSCGHCKECDNDCGQLCREKALTYNGIIDGQTTFGGYANKVRVQAAWAIKIPDNISSEEGAPLLCAGVTTYRPFKHYNLGPDTRVGVIGIGGLGHLALQWARALRCREVVALSSSDHKKDEAFEMGATRFISLKDEPLAQDAGCLDVLLVCGSGKSTDWNYLFYLLDIHGILFLLDLPEEPIPILAPIFVNKHVSIVGSFVGSNHDLKDMLDLASKTGVRPWVNKIGNSLEQVNQGICDLMDGKAHYRIVICGEGRE